MKNKKLRINSQFVSGYKQGDIVEIQVDLSDVPIDPFWRQRLKDAQSDECCEFVKEEKAKKPKKEVKKHDD